MKKIFLFAAATLALAACDTTEDIADSSRVPLSIFASIDGSAASRAADTSWDENDRIGITVTVGSLEIDSYHPHLNLKYTHKEDNKFEGDTMFFHNHMTLTGYYPYAGEQDAFPASPDAPSGILKLKTTADMQAKDNQKDIDFLYAKRTGIRLAEATEGVELPFSHRMAKLTFTFVNASKDPKHPMDVSKMVAYSLEGLRMDGSFNTLTGECAADEDATFEELRIETRDEEGKPLVTEKVPMPSLLVFPQIPEIEEAVQDDTDTGTDTNADTNADTGADTPETRLINKVRLNMLIDEANTGGQLQRYHCTISFGDNRLKPGLHYDFTVYVTKIGMIIGEMKIVPWDEIPGSLAATIDGDIDEKELPDE